MMAEALIFKAIAATQEIDFSFWALFVRATITVKIVILLLIGASFWAWSIIIQRHLVFNSARRDAARFDRAFWSGEPLDELYQQLGQNPRGRSAKIFVAENTATATPSHREAPPPSPPPPPPPPPLPPPSCLRSGASVGNTRAYDIVEATVVTSSAGSVAAISMGASTELIALRRKTWCLCRCLAAKGKSRFSVVHDRIPTHPHSQLKTSTFSGLDNKTLDVKNAK